MTIETLFRSSAIGRGLASDVNSDTLGGHEVYDSAQIDVDAIRRPKGPRRDAPPPGVSKSLAKPPTTDPYAAENIFDDIGGGTTGPVGEVAETDTPGITQQDASRGQTPRSVEQKLDVPDDPNYEMMARGGLMMAEGLIDIANARARAKAAERQARLNIEIAQRRANSTITNAMTRSRRARVQGKHTADKLKAYMAAQGQDVTGSAVDKAAYSHEIQFMNSAMLEEINGYRTALGFQEQIVMQESAIANAKVQRDLDTIMGVTQIAAGGILIGAS